jgi:hypothetical protein
MSLMTLFTVIFALACLTTFALGFERAWKRARIVSTVVAILAFFLALLSASVNK